MRTQELMVRACTKFQAVLRRLRVQKAMFSFDERWDRIESRDGGPPMWLDQVTMEVFVVHLALLTSILVVDIQAKTLLLELNHASIHTTNQCPPAEVGSETSVPHACAFGGRGDSVPARPTAATRRTSDDGQGRSFAGLAPNEHPLSCANVWLTEGGGRHAPIREATCRP